MDLTTNLENLDVMGNLTLDVGKNEKPTVRMLISRIKGQFKTYTLPNGRLMVTKLSDEFKPGSLGAFVEKFLENVGDHPVRVPLAGRSPGGFRDMLPPGEYETKMQGGELYVRRKPHAVDIHAEVAGMEVGETRVVELRGLPYAHVYSKLNRGEYSFKKADDGCIEVTRLQKMTDTEYKEYVTLALLGSHDVVLQKRYGMQKVIKEVARELRRSVVINGCHVRVLNVAVRLKYLEVGESADYVRYESNRVQRFLMNKSHGQYRVDAQPDGTGTITRVW